MASRRFVNALRIVINEHSREGDSNTPDFVLARFLQQSLTAFDLAVTHRDDWHAVDDIPSKADGYASQVKASLEVLALAANTYVFGPRLTAGEAYHNLVNALNLPRVRDALKEGD